ncbi:MAG TPA: HNH endonuclease, partial [Arthrobacter sp.]|nr:HNH endonuclease [Arthrobacter sp.]
MEAVGEQGAEGAAGTGVSGLSAASLLRGRGLRSVPAAASLAAVPVGGASDGGAAPATAYLKASLALLDSAVTAAQEELAA